MSLFSKLFGGSTPKEPEAPKREDPVEHEGLTIVAAPEKADGGQCPGGSERLLLVEDELEVRRFAARVLEGLGYRVAAVGDAASALDLLVHDGDFDLMLSDIELPGGKDGVELARDVARHWPGIRLLMMSGYPDRVLQADGAFLEATGLLSKPFDKAMLARVVRERLDKQAEEDMRDD